MLSSFYKKFSYGVWNFRGLWLRVGFCWLIGFFFLVHSYGHQFDFRLKLRGEAPIDSRILLINITQDDWVNRPPLPQTLLRPTRTLLTETDDLLWDIHIWQSVLESLLDADVAAIGVTLFFSQSVRLPPLTSRMNQLFSSNRVVWAADLDGSNRILTPIFQRYGSAVFGLRNFRRDDDGITRRINLQEPANHLALNLAKRAHSVDISAMKLPRSPLINFRGPRNRYPTYSVQDVINGVLDSEDLKGKIIVIGNMTQDSELIQTPMGRMSRSELTANVIDSLINKRFITPLSIASSLGILFFFLLISLWILNTYPHTIAFMFFILVVSLWSAISTFAFDAWSLWLPVLSPTAQMTVTYIVFLSHQLGVNERRAWRLSQEQRAREEIEKLKGNFVSMMSHDLKTPIAKIQAICERLLMLSLNKSLQKDLKSLKSASEELRAYIQSILKVSRLEAADFQVVHEVTDINENILRVVSRLESVASEKNIKITTNLEPLFSIEADTTLIPEIIHNLIENAIKYSPPNTEIEIRSRENDDKVIVEVEDSGLGIPRSALGHVWKKFYRANNLPVESKGSGLGLYLVKYFVERHGGRVFLDSEVGRGTCIGFSLPVQIEDLEKKTTKESLDNAQN